MVKFNVLLIITLALSINAQGQSSISGTVVYKASHDNTLIDHDKESTNKEGIKGANDLLNNASNVYSTLKFNEKESSYRVDEELKVDGMESINITYFFAGGKNLFYHNKDSLGIIISNSSLGKEYLIKYDAPNWKITKETKQIGDLLCVKAYVTATIDKKEKKIASAWYCPNIPISCGPMQYFGLPGLILELHFSKMTLVAEKINLDEENVIIEKHKESSIITQEEFLAIAKEKASGFFDD